MKRFNIIYLLLAVIMVVSCNSNKPKEDVDFNDSAKVANNAHVNSVLVHAIVKSMPPPVELTSFIKDNGVSFNSSVLNTTDNRNKYASVPERALALGIYGADLGYINFFEKTYESLDYLNTVKDIAEQLNIGQFFDFSTLKRLALNKESIDSIIFITTDNFEKMNVYLTKQNRGNVSAFMLIGGWIESMHLVCNAAGQQNNRLLVEQVGEQKVVLDELLILLGLFKEDKDFERLTVYFNELKPLFEQVTVNYEYREPITKESNGMLIVEDNSKKEVIISDATFQAINKKIEEIRQYVLK
ncbi:MAG: hypothetical protein IT239_03380 [Bacteroidia bacterium]|nr:hypothetical protein [Bacteroidia bacterium]